MSSSLRLGWPNRITIGRILLVGPFVACLMNLDEAETAWLRWGALGIFLLMAVSDMLDGYLARRLSAESDLGKFLDPMADKLLITSSVVILWASGVEEPASGRELHLPNWAAVAAIGKDLVSCFGFLVIYLVTNKLHIEPRRLGKWCTGVQMVLVLAMILWIDLPTWFAPVPAILWTLATGLAIATALDYVRMGMRHLAAYAAEQDEKQTGEPS